MRLQVPLAPLYSISEPETIFVQLPATALRSDASMFASPALVISADPGFGRFGAHLDANPQEEVLRMYSGTNLSMVLSGDSWVPTVGQPHLGEEALELNVALVRGLISAQSEVTGWNQVVLPGLLGALTGLVRINDQTVLIEIPHFANYEIQVAEE